VPCSDNLGYLGAGGAQVSSHRAFTAMAKFLLSGVANEIQQMRVVATCAATA
jgi:hypothetical protein